MLAPFPLQFIQVDILYFIWLNTQAIQCLTLCAVVERNHQLRNTSAEGFALVISESFTKSVRSVISLQVDCLTPLLNQSVDRGNCQCASLT